MTKLEELKANYDAANAAAWDAAYAAYDAAAARDAALEAYKNEHEKQKEKKND